jgi:hypothetical protein
LSVTGVDDLPGVDLAQGLARNHPNPGAGTTIQYDLEREARVMLEVYDVEGSLVDRRDLGMQPAGTRETWYEGTGGGSDGGSGVYLYRLRIVDPQSGQTQSILTGKMTLTR